MSTQALFTNQTATGYSSNKAVEGANSVFQADGITSSGAGSAVIDIEVSLDQTMWSVAGTITLTLSTTLTADGFTMAAKWPFARARVRSISGTGASVNVKMAGST